MQDISWENLLQFLNEMRHTTPGGPRTIKVCRQGRCFGLSDGPQVHWVVRGRMEAVQEYPTVMEANQEYLTAAGKVRNLTENDIFTFS